MNEKNMSLIGKKVTHLHEGKTKTGVIKDERMVNGASKVNEVAVRFSDFSERWISLRLVKVLE